MLSAITNAILFIVSHFSYGGLVLLMGIESANIPLPSELIMPAAGYLVSQGMMNIHIAAIAGAFGCLLGSLLSYYLGMFGGRPFLERYGRYLLMGEHDLERGDALFKRFGDEIALISRLLPIVRTFISFPAGVARMNIWKFAIYTFIGSLLWSYILLFIGMRIGQNREIIATYFHKFDTAIGILIVIGLALYLYSHIRKLKKS